MMGGVTATPDDTLDAFADDGGWVPSRRANALAVIGFLASLVLAAVTAMPAQYAIEGPGPTFNTLALVDGEPVVGISGAPTFDTTGELRLTTVSVSRGGDRWFSVGDVMQAYFSPARRVQPQEVVFGDPADREVEQERSVQQWVTSQDLATVAALEQVGTEVPADLRIAGAAEDSNALDLVAIDDLIVAVDGQPLDGYADLVQSLAGKEPGEAVTLTLDRGGEPAEVTFDLLASESGDALMGLYIDPQFDYPIDVEVRVDDVTGPSAGLMFALAIIDRLTPEDELDGARVAGTGTIGVDGDVGPIGGIQLKMYGAVSDGATSFLAPVENCAEVIGHIPGGLSVYAVDTLGDAYDALLAIGDGATDSLPTCSSVLDNP